MQNYSHLIPQEIIDELWEQVIDFTKIRKGGININQLLVSLFSNERKSDTTYK